MASEFQFIAVSHILCIYSADLDYAVVECLFVICLFYAEMAV